MSNCSLSLCQDVKDIMFAHFGRDFCEFCALEL